jgi:hypothetical protein
MVKILANTFHRSAYFDRIQDSLFHQYVLETISKPMKKLSIAAAKKIKPPAKTPEIPKVIQMCCTGPKYVECSPRPNPQGWILYFPPEPNFKDLS